MWLNEWNSYIRWTADNLIGLGLVLFIIKSINRAYFPFSFAFFSGFNVLFVTIAVKGILMLIFKDWIMLEVPDGISGSKWLGYSVFRESLSHFVIGIATVTLLSWLLMKKRMKL
jgi:uncharacterized membrane protein YjdF